MGNHGASGGGVMGRRGGVAGVLVVLVSSAFLLSTEGWRLLLLPSSSVQRGVVYCSSPVVRTPYVCISVLPVAVWSQVACALSGHLH